MNGEGEKDDENAEIYENENQIFNGLIKKNIMWNKKKNNLQNVLS